MEDRMIDTHRTNGTHVEGDGEVPRTDDYEALHEQWTQQKQTAAKTGEQLRDSAKREEERLLSQLARVRETLAKCDVKPAPRLAIPPAGKTIPHEEVRLRLGLSKKSPILAAVPKKKRARLARRSSEQIAAQAARVVALLKQAGGKKGMRAEIIREQLGFETREMPAILKYALDAKSLRSTGQKRATTYFAR